MKASGKGRFAGRGSIGTVALLLTGSMLGGIPAAFAQDAADAPSPAPVAPTAATAPADTIATIDVTGNQRLERDTVLSYVKLRPGQPYTQEAADQALKDLYATELFANVTVRNNGGNVVIAVVENPVINRIILEGNKRLKSDKILPEIKLAPRQIYTRSKVRADVARIIELYKRQGRFAATVEPKAVQLDQNRVDIVFEIEEGPKSKVRQINIIGNEVFSDGDLRSEMVTKQARLFRLFSSTTSYDPDRLAYDQQKLRQFYLTEGYADFRVVSAVAELTPDKEDFIITYVVEEGERYKFGDVKVDSQIRDFDSGRLTANLPIKSGNWYNAKLVEDTVTNLSETAGLFGYAFADVRPQFRRNAEDRTMAIEFVITESPRVYVERIDVNGNTLTKDKVVRREFRLSEGDAFNSFQVKRSTNRIKSLGYFQDDFEVQQEQGSAPDRIVLNANVQEKSTGELQLSAGFSSIESFIFQGSIRQRNFRGMGQELRASASISRYSRSVQLGFTEPYFLDKAIALSGDIFRRDYNSFNFINDERETTYSQVSTGFQVRTGVPINEYLYASLRYGLTFEDVTLDEDLYFTNGVCDPNRAGRYLCDAIGKRTVSSVGYSMVYDTRDNRIRSTRGTNITLSQDFAGLGGNVRYVRQVASAQKFFPLGSGFIFSVKAEGGYIHPLEDRGLDGVDDVRLTDRFFLGEPQFRGFDIRGVGPRIQRITLQPGLDGGGNPVLTAVEDEERIRDDAIGGRAYYLGRAEIEIPLGSSGAELGLRPSIFVDVGALFGVERPNIFGIGDPRAQANGTVTERGPDGAVVYRDNNGTGNVVAVADPANLPTGVAPGASTGPLYVQNVAGQTVLTTNMANATGDNLPYQAYFERFLGNSAKPRLTVGAGVNWNSPFGPFRIDVSTALLKEEGDDTKTFSFNVGTQF